MPPNEDHELRSVSRGKYARLDDAAEDDIPLRASFESYASSLGSQDPLDYDASTLKRKRSKNDLLNRKPSHNRDAERAATVPPRRRGFSVSRICCGILVFLTLCLVLLLGFGGIVAYKTSSADSHSPPWYPTPKGGTDAAWAKSYKKAAKLVKQMTLVEKVNVTTGTGWSMGPCVGNTGPVPRLKFPSLCLQDGPLGIRFADHVTAFPAGITVGATWNRELMYQRGRALGRENRLKGIHVMLGPSIGALGRLPAGGRNWEGFGTDPVLQAVGAAETIQGIQDEGVQACAKHFVANEQEHFRQAWAWGPPNAISSNVDDRTLHEIYAWPFAESVKAGVASVMCSYNQVNNSYACQNSKLLNGVLKDELGFQGWVQSDWLGQRAGVASALAGLDVTMPGDGLKWEDGKSLWGEQLTTAVLNGSVSVERIDDMVTRVVAAWYQLGQDDAKVWPAPPPDGEGGPNFSSWTNEETGAIHPRIPDSETGVVNKFVDVRGEHGKLVRRVAAEGTVLLKNVDNILPLSRKGQQGTRKAQRQNKFRVGIFGEDARLSEKGLNACKDQACNEGTLAIGWGSGTANFTYLIDPISALRKAFDSESVQLTEWLENILPSDKTILEDQDVCIVFANSDAGEGYIHWNGVRGDRNDLYLQKGGDALIQGVAASCDNVIVVLHTVGPVIIENWIDLPAIRAVLVAHLPGQESGNSLVDVLFGDMNPSGHLPYTIAKKEDDYGPTSKVKYLPNPLDGLTPQQNFSEGLYIDYRYFDKNDITPRYEFGFGLSYTTFELSDLTIKPHVKKTLLPAPRPKGIQPPSYSLDIPDRESALLPEGFTKLDKFIYPWITSTTGISRPHKQKPETPHPPSPAGGAQGGNPDLYTTVLNVTARVKNTGPVDGAAVVQLYISLPPGYRDEQTDEPVDFPVRVLRGFEKVVLASESNEDEVGKGKGNGKTEKVVTFKVTRKDLSYWDVRRQNWVLPTRGKIGIAVGFSSRDLVLHGTW